MSDYVTRLFSHVGTDDPNGNHLENHLVAMARRLDLEEGKWYRLGQSYSLNGGPRYTLDGLVRRDGDAYFVDDITIQPIDPAVGSQTEEP